MPNPRKLSHSRRTSWEIAYRVDGQMARRRFPTRAQAVDELARARVDIARGQGLLPVDAKISVADYTEQWLTTLRVPPSTRANDVSHLRNHPAGAGVAADVLAAAQPHRRVRGRPGRQGTGRLDGQALLQRAVDDHAVRLLRPGPAHEPLLQDQAPGDPGRTLPLTPAQVHAVLSAAPDCDWAFLATAVGTGLRQGEPLGLRLVHLNLLRRQLAVEQQAMSPSGDQPFLTSDLKTPSSRRVVPLPQFVVLELARHLETYGAGTQGVVFANRRGAIWRRGSFNDSVWKPALRRAGLDERFRLHALRHTYASGLIAENVHPRVIQARLGHKSIVETMDTYGHPFPDGRDETTNALDRIFGSIGPTEEAARGGR